MVTRKTKLIAAGAVLTVGFGLAWPLRRKAEPVVAAPPSPATATATVAAAFLTLSGSVDLDAASPLANSSAAALPAVAESAVGPTRDPFATAATPPNAVPAAEPALTEPLYSTVAGIVEGGDDRPQGERIHVISNGDTLERLAKRYLGDDSRAIEIFDLNQDVMPNPHLLEIGVELRIPPVHAATPD